MISVNLSTEVIETGYDPKTQTCNYVAQRNGRRWTVRIPLKDLEAYGTKPGHKIRRQQHLGNVLAAAMRGKADGEK